MTPPARAALRRPGTSTLAVTGAELALTCGPHVAHRFYLGHRMRIGAYHFVLDLV